MNHRFTYVTGIVATATLTVALSACGGGATSTTTSGGYTVTLVDEEKLTVCTNLPYVPFQYEEDGDIVGFDVDLMDLVADELGVEQEIVDLKFDSIESGAAMTGDKCDLAAAGITITDDRKPNLTFSEPYFEETLAFLTADGETIDSIDEVKERDLTLGVQSATTSFNHAVDNGMDPTQFEDSGKQLQALRSGTIDVILQDEPVINEWMSDSDNADAFEVGGTVETGEQYGFAFKKDADETLVEVVNDTISAARSDGTYDELYEQWFGAESGES
ncbi:transporter substrate-binding domain-containing protein [Haloglycomyces albus]|uniref:transporter substrate-binding domain-containing protein n=1 Tax=Haloglycomyces albus TaxID=526067 RepID=UPI00046CDC63|nr:transporter substrate-binding domain-containing protein [Haloglycomyces albus]